MENKSNNSGLKAAVVILVLLLLGSIGYIIKLTTDNKETVTTLTTEKETLAEELKAKIAEYDLMISDNTALKEELQAEQAKMVELLEQVEKSKGDLAAMAKYKASYLRLKGEMDNLVAENKLLKEQNVTLTSSLDSTTVVLEETKKFNDTLLVQNEGLTKTVEKGSKLAVLNLKVLAVKERSSGKQIETDKAGRANKLKISFLIAENQIAKTGSREYYVQIIDSKNNILGEKTTIPAGDKTLTYSFISTVKYENKTVQVNEELSGEDFAAGTYFVNVFDKNMELVSKTSFNLR
ncbi:hypothetical protein FLCU109888_10075 [Flavobacterium cucumis]|uniref:Uncharacterized protein n=1 Tax=Flavobacterium cucumis TaxID=416016 RepID=A0A1M7ZZB7_9FLAO|nr:hypothetical protein [Flavobacterium cucumis]SHO74215.1 hypothetical protein SAMN05443547_2601 [Flavobacterium cucumis]